MKPLTGKLNILFVSAAAVTSPNFIPSRTLHFLHGTSFLNNRQDAATRSDHGVPTPFPLPLRVATTGKNYLNEEILKNRFIYIMLFYGKVILSKHSYFKYFLTDGAINICWCGVAQYGAAWLSMVRRGSVGRASACCKAGPSSILGLAPQGGLSH